MTNFASQLARIEQECKLKLPESYRRLMSNYPSLLLAIHYFNDPKWGGPYSFVLLQDPAEVLTLNLEMRELWPDSDYSELPLPDTYLFVGHDGCGNTFAIDTAGPDTCPVLEFDHEDPCWISRAGTLDEFVDQLIAEAKEKGWI